MSKKNSFKDRIVNNRVSLVVWKVYFIVIMMVVMILYLLQFYRSIVDVYMIIFGLMVLCFVFYILLKNE